MKKKIFVRRRSSAFWSCGGVRCVPERVGGLVLMPPGVLAPVPVSCVVGSKSEVSLLGYDACPPEVASNLRDCGPCVLCVSGRDLCSRNTRSPFLAQWYGCLFLFSFPFGADAFFFFFVCGFFF